jgi:hypothetical protein
MTKKQQKEQTPADQVESRGIYLQWGKNQHVFDSSSVRVRQGGDAVFLQLKCTCKAPAALVGMDLEAAKALHSALGQALVIMEKTADLPAATVEGVFHA